jgi:hypothetical protein
LNVIDTGHGLYPGGVHQLTDGIYVLAYMADDPSTGNSAIYVRETVDLLGTYSPPTLLSEPALRAGYDPGVIRLDDGTVIATWWGSSRAYYAIRNALGNWSAPLVLHADKKYGFISDEQTVRRVRLKTWQVYNRKLATETLPIFDIMLRQLGAPAGVITSDVVVAPAATGTGTQGKQKRNALTGTGSTAGLLLVYGRNADGGSRDIWALRSEDDGLTWDPPGTRIATLPGQDLANPFALRIGTKVRVYFSAQRAGLCHIDSLDHGLTWSQLVKDRLPDPAAPARMVAVNTPTGIVGICTSSDFTTLGSLPLL